MEAPTAYFPKGINRNSINSVQHIFLTCTFSAMSMVHDEDSRGPEDSNFSKGKHI